MPHSTPGRRPKRHPSGHPTRQPPSFPVHLLIEPPFNSLPTRKEILELAGVFVIAAIVSVCCRFIVGVYNIQNKPFCDSKANFDELTPDNCEPCPNHGHCDHGQLKCDQGYRKQGRICVEDGDVEDTAKKLFEQAKNQLCAAYAQFMCDGSGFVWASEEELRNDMDSFFDQERYRVDTVAYAFAKKRAIETINNVLDTRLNDNKVVEFKCPKALAERYRPISCRARQWIARHSLILTSVSAPFGIVIFLLSRLRRRWYLSETAVELYEQVCDILEENAIMSKSMNGGEPWVVSSRLRDHVLSPSERKDQQLWKKVEQLMGEDSRLECYPKLVKGESKVVWEWQVEGSLSNSGRRKKARVGHQNSSGDKRVSDGKEKA